MTAVLVACLVIAWLALTIALPIAAVTRAARAARAARSLRERLASIDGELARLREEVARLGGASRRPEASEAPPLQPREPAQAAAAAGPRSPVVVVGPVSAPPTMGTALEPPVPTSPLGGRAATTPDDERPSISLEDRIGSRWLLYVGLATLVLGASYFIKYAFENNWVTPVMRVTLGAAMGALLVALGQRFSFRGFALYGQMLAAGGIVVLYVSIYAALNFYVLISPTAAFALMAAVTGVAAARAHGEASQGLAALAVAGGFLTPFLVGGDVDVQAVLFTYDAILVLGTLWLARQHRWPALHLVSFGLTVFTIVTWAEAYYSPGRWLPTQLWLTLFAVLFLLIWRTLPQPDPATSPLDHRAASVILGLSPLLYHATSLSLLWHHSAGLFVYVIAITAACVVVAGHYHQPWIRLGTWFVVAAPMLGWLTERPGRWDTAPFVTLITIYLLHLVAQARELHGDEDPPPVEIVLSHANGLWLWGGLALLLERFAYSRLGAMTFALAGWNGVLAAVAVLRSRGHALHLLALAGALLATAFAIEFEGPAITVAWAAEGAAIVGIGLFVDRRWLRLAGGALLTAAVVRLVQHLAAPPPVTASVVLNARSFSTMFVVALLVALAWAYRRRVKTLPHAETALALLVVSANVLVLLWATSEVVAWFGQSAWQGAGLRGAGAVTSATLGREVALSTLWAVYGLAVVAAGIQKRYRPLRLLGIALFGITIAKVFLVDLSQLDRFYRILSTVGLGILLLVASYLYQRFTREHEVHVADASGHA